MQPPSVLSRQWGSVLEGEESRPQVRSLPNINQETMKQERERRQQITADRADREKAPSCPQKKKKEESKVMSLEMFSVCLLKGSWWTLLSSMQPPRHRPGPEGHAGSKPSLLETSGGLPLQRASEPRARTKASPSACPALPKLTAAPAKPQLGWREGLA